MRRRTSLVLAAVIFALSGVLIVVPALANTTTVTAAWDHSAGLLVTPGSLVELARVSVAAPAGASCTAEMEATNGQSQHPGNNLVLYRDGVLVLTLLDIEAEPFEHVSDSVTLESDGDDEYVVFLEVTQATRTSTAGDLVVDCTDQPPTTTTTGPPTSTTEPPTSTTEPPTSTTTGPPTSTTEPPTPTAVPGPPPTGETPPAPGDHEEPAGNLGALFGLVGMVGLVGSAVLATRRNQEH